MSAQKTERLLNLVICLLSTRQFLSQGPDPRARCRSTPSAAPTRPSSGCSSATRTSCATWASRSRPAATARWFEDEVGYRIDRAAYALPEISFEPDELAVLGLASRVWQQASLAGPASRALLKLKAAGVEPDEASLVGIEPRVRTSEPAFEPLYAAVRDRAAGHASPTAPPARASSRERHLEPWGIVSLARAVVRSSGHDRDRDATRVFRLSRVAGPVATLGRAGRRRRAGRGRLPGPGGRAADGRSPAAEATVRARTGAGVALRGGEPAPPRSSARTAGTS